VWDFTPGDLNIEWGHVLKELGLQGVGIVPYQLRHSGVSIDLAKGTRTLLAAQKRGFWGSQHSMARYEKHGRLNVGWLKLKASQRAWLEAASAVLEAVVFGRTNGPPLPTRW